MSPEIADRVPCFADGSERRVDAEEPARAALGMLR